MTIEPLTVEDLSPADWFARLRVGAEPVEEIYIDGKTYFRAYGDDKRAEDAIWIDGRPMVPFRNR